MLRLMKPMAVPFTYKQKELISMLNYAPAFSCSYSALEQEAVFDRANLKLDRQKLKSDTFKVFRKYVIESNLSSV